MSKRNRARPHSNPDFVTEPAGEEDEPLEEIEDEPAAARDLAMLLEDAGLGFERTGAVFVMAYARHPATRAHEPKLLHVARLVHSLPMLWSAAMICDFVRFTFGLSLCNLPAATTTELQTLLSEVERELAAPRAKASAPGDAAGTAAA